MGERGDLPVHPARFPADLPEYFVRMLTDPGDIVVDPFGGSCVTGEVCQRLRKLLQIWGGIQLLSRSATRSLGKPSFHWSWMGLFCSLCYRDMF